MNWFGRKERSKEVAALVRSAVEKLEQELARGQDRQGQQQQQQQEEAEDASSAALAASTSAQVIVDGGRLTDMLMAGQGLIDWLMEDHYYGTRDRPLPPESPSPRPQWCLRCGRRGDDLREPGQHREGCEVGMWLRATRGLKVTTAMLSAGERAAIEDQ